MEKVMLAPLVFPAIFQRTFQAPEEPQGRRFQGHMTAVSRGSGNTTGFCSVFISMYSLCKALGFTVTSSCTHPIHLFDIILFYTPNESSFHRRILKSEKFQKEANIILFHQGPPILITKPAFEKHYSCVTFPSYFAPVLESSRGRTVQFTDERKWNIREVREATQQPTWNLCQFDYSKEKKNLVLSPGSNTTVIGKSILATHSTLVIF